MNKRCLCLVSVSIAIALLSSGCSLLVGNQAPISVIDASPRQGTAPLRVQFDAWASTDDEAITGYRWEISDVEGTTVFEPAFEHRFEQAGEYLIRLTVTDRQGESTVSQQAIEVINTPPIASCRFSNDAPVRRENVLFDASASLDLDGQLVDFIWEFGDGSTRRGTRVSHAYEDIGLYLVRLTVVDNSGAQTTSEHQMTVHEGSSGGGCGGR